MNFKTINKGLLENHSFRPQQGLPIMNEWLSLIGGYVPVFPSPTGVTYYESLPTKP